MKYKVIFKNHRLLLLFFFLIVTILYLFIELKNYLYILDLIVLILLNLSLFFSFKFTVENSKCFKICFLVLFPLTFMLILLVVLINIAFIVLNWKNTFFVLVTITIICITLIAILQIFNNWWYYSKKHNIHEDEDKYLTIIKDTYSLLSLISTLVIPIINLGFPKGKSLSAADTLGYIGVIIGGSLICHTLEYIYKHHYKISNCYHYFRAIIRRDFDNKDKGMN